MSEGRDLRWYQRRVIGPDGRLRRYTGGPLKRFSIELDAYFYGIPRKNQVARDHAGVMACCRLMDLFAGREEVMQLAPIPEPVMEDTTEWVRHLHAIWDDETALSGYSNPTVAVDFVLDVKLALYHIPKSDAAAFIHYMDGYNLEEIRHLAARTPGKPWSEATTERAVRRASRAIRARCGIDVPGGRRAPNPDARSTSVINAVEDLIEQIRSRSRSTQ